MKISYVQVAKKTSRISISKIRDVSFLLKNDKSVQKKCAECKQEFNCTASSSASCWCMTYPALLSSDTESDCLCPECLKKRLAPHIDQITREIIDAQRPNHVANFYPSNCRRLIEGIDFYREGSLMVLTEWYHLKRGFCCGNKCRHCPYQHENVLF